MGFIATAMDPNAGTPTAVAPVLVAPVVAQSNKAMMAGVMYIIALLIGLYQFYGIYTAWSYTNMVGGIIGGAGGAAALGMWGMVSGILLPFMILSLVGVIGCLLAAIFCFTKKKYPIALVGGILAFVGLHFLFGLIGFLWMTQSKAEFAA